MQQKLKTLLWATVVLFVVFLLAEVIGDVTFFWEARAETETETSAETVDCFLPGQIRPLGSTTYITRSRTIKTTKKECEARGGRPIYPEKPETEIREGKSAGQDDHSPK